MKNGVSKGLGHQIDCPACGKSQRVSRAGGRVQCGHCRSRIELLDAESAPDSALAALQQRVEALEGEVAALRALSPSPELPAAPREKRVPHSGALTLAERLQRCRAGRLTICFSEKGTEIEGAVTRICQFFAAAKWEVGGPQPVVVRRGASTLAVGSLPMAAAAADLFMALKAAGVAVESVLDQDLAANEACLTVNRESALSMAPEEDSPAVRDLAAQPIPTIASAVRGL